MICIMKKHIHLDMLFTLNDFYIVRKLDLRKLFYIILSVLGRRASAILFEYTVES